MTYNSLLTPKINVLLPRRICSSQLSLVSAKTCIAKTHEDQVTDTKAELQWQCLELDARS